MLSLPLIEIRMAVHKLHIEEFDEIDYQLIAIHTSLEDYRLAYFLNQQLPILFKRSDDDVQITTREGVACFPHFIYSDGNEDTTWELVANQGDIMVVDSNNANLFANTTLEVATRVYLLPEFKKVSY